jgi:hypothetical protein
MKHSRKKKYPIDYVYSAASKCSTLKEFRLIYNELYQSAHKNGYFKELKETMWPKNTKGPKVCSKCGEEKKESEFANKKYKDKVYLSSTCRDCARAYQREYAKENKVWRKETSKESRKRWAEKNKDKIRKYHQEWRKRNPEKAAFYVRRWIENNPERIKSLRAKHNQLQVEDK